MSLHVAKFSATCITVVVATRFSLRRDACRS